MHSLLSKTYPLGRLFGVEVKAHASLPWLLGLLAVVGLLAGGPGAVLGGAFVVLGLILSVTLHELGHIGAASLFGNPTRGITLTPIGGVATLERESHTPREEAVVALAGPAVSLMLAGLAAIPLVAFGPSLVAEWFLRLNLMLALFNLLPAYPMDGGRVLRAALWRKQGYLSASELAAKAGQAFGVLFVVGGLVVSPMLSAVGLYVLWHASAERNRLSGIRLAQRLHQGEALDPRAVAAQAFAQLLFGQPSAQASSVPPAPPRRPIHARHASPFSRVEWVRGPDGRAVPVDRSPW